MNASPPPEVAADPDDDIDDSYDEVLPVRPRASYLTPLTALLMALILGGIGFYVGIRVEQSQTTSAGGGASSAFARALSGGTPGAATSAGRTGSSGFAGAGSPASRFAAGGFAGAGGGTAGSISSVSGNTIYVKETSGNTVKVRLSSATAISKSEKVSRSKLYPGEQVVVSGTAASNGTLHATAVTDSGAGSTSASTGSSSASATSATSSSSAIGSLFGGG